MGVAFAGSSTMTFWPTYAVDEAGLPLTKVGLVMLFNPVAMVLGSALSGTITNALPRPRVLVMLPGVALPVIFIALLHVQSLPLLGLLFFGNGFVQALSIPLLMSVPFQLGLTPREVSVATAHMRTVVPTGGALGPIVVGLISGATGSLELAMTVTAPFAVTLLFGSQLLPGFQSRKQRLALRERERPAAGTSE
jgi:predicted MFS family arabinose efflux permease